MSFARELGQPNMSAMDQRFFLLWVVLGIALATTGCMSERVVYDGWASFPQDPKAIANRGREAHANDTQTWAVPIKSFQGGDRSQRATQMGRDINRVTGMSDAWVTDDGNRSTVLYGRFTDPHSTQAQLALHAIQQLEVDEQQPYAKAQLQPVASLASVSSSPHDLAQYSGLYSLQIAAFQDADRALQRRAAKQYVQQLRDEGEDAYYYHGRTMSLVTVGLFRKSEALVSVPNPMAPGSRVERYSPRVVELQKKYPDNLVNGRTLIEKQDGKVVGNQPSVLVPVP